MIIPIPKVGKDPQDSSCCPISLTSHVVKLMEQMVAARLTHDRDNTIPAEQVGL